MSHIVETLSHPNGTTYTIHVDSIPLRQTAHGYVVANGEYAMPIREFPTIRHVIDEGKRMIEILCGPFETPLETKE